MSRGLSLEFEVRGLRIETTIIVQLMHGLILLGMKELKVKTTLHDSSFDCGRERVRT